MSKETEDKIEKASKIFEKNFVKVGDKPFEIGFIEGALSSEAKEHWQKGMWTNEEVKQLLIKFKSFLWEREDFSTATATKWFEPNKKKS